MHFPAPRFSVLSHWVAEMVGPRMGRFRSSCRQGLIHRRPLRFSWRSRSGLRMQPQEPSCPQLWLVWEFPACGYKATAVPKFTSTQPVSTRAYSLPNCTIKVPVLITPGNTLSPPIHRSSSGFRFCPKAHKPPLSFPLKSLL